MGTNNRPSSPADRAQADLRRSIRFDLQVPVSFSWVDERGVRQVGEGRSRDISASGAFVIGLPCPPAGATVDLNFLLSLDPLPTQNLQIQAMARVVRVEQADRAEETPGFAVASHKVVFLRGSEAIDEWIPPMVGPGEKRSGGAGEVREGDE
jgi:hypothetical protein